MNYDYDPYGQDQDTIEEIAGFVRTIRRGLRAIGPQIRAEAIREAQIGMNIRKEIGRQMKPIRVVDTRWQPKVRAVRVFGNNNRRAIR